MQSLSNNIKTMQASLSSKTISIQEHPTLRRAIREYFLKTYALYQQLFDILGMEQAYYYRAQPLRHPLIFYYGHTACLYINKLFDWGVIHARVNPQYEKIFAVGVDEMDWDDLNQSHYDWPSVADTKLYRDKVKNVVLQAIDRSKTNSIENWCNDMWVVLLGIEHERIHLETSAVIMRRLPLQMVKNVEEFVECPSRIMSNDLLPKNEMKNVGAWKGRWQRKVQKAQTYGWDNEFGEKQFNVSEFKASEMLVSNGEFLEFVNAGGYNHPEWWTEEGRKWIASIKPQMPLFWRKQGDSYRLRTLFQEISMPWDWPAEVNNLEARAFCKWRTEKTGKYTRLPTEDEYYALRSLLPKDQPEWEYQEVGNINLEYWMSPNPVNMFKTGDFYDIIGNVWQHTITPIYPFSKFQIHPVYNDFTTPTFDERHDIIKGGSFISTGNQALYHARFAFRRHFYQFAGFRYIESDIEMEVDTHSTQIISDKNVEMSLQHHYQNNKSYVLEVVEAVKQVVGEVRLKKILTVGCSVGRISWQLGHIFDESIGIDYTTRYFQMSTRLKEAGHLKFKDIDINLKEMNIEGDNVHFLQMNPQNPDGKKINYFDMILIDGYCIRKGSIKEVISNIVKLANKNAIVVVLNASGINEIKNEEAQEIIKQIRGVECQFQGEKKLQASEKDQNYLPERQGQIQFRLSHFRLLQ